MKKFVAGVAAVAVAIALQADVAAAKPAPDTTFRDIGAALQAHGIVACETDWAMRSPTQDGTGRTPSGRKEFPEERDQRSRIVTLAPQPCPPLDPQTGDVYGDDATKVGLIDVREFKQQTAGASLKKHGKIYTGPGIGYVYQGTTLITLNDGVEPPSLAAAFTAAMKDLHARRRWVGDVWRQTHP
jgi:hypothetical protein